jgi:hypothetical protein|tara:strand:+ start:685 stop:834 length:150 start_codon:yes stop_codon:yes gene_type:complete
MYLYIVLGVYYFCGIVYFSYNDYNYAKNDVEKIVKIDQSELFDKLIENE